MSIIVSSLIAAPINIGGFGDEAVAAFIVFLLGILFTILYQRLAEKKRKIACTHTIYQPKLQLGKKIADRVKISLDNRVVDSLAVHHLSIKNSGDFAIRDQEVLFEFKQDQIEILDNGINCEKLTGPVVKLDNTPANQFRYKIVLLPRDKSVDFHFYAIVPDIVIEPLRIEWRNETDTEVVITMQKGGQMPIDKSDIQRVLIFFIAYAIIPISLSSLRFFGEIAAFACRLSLALMAYPSLRRLLNAWSWKPAKNAVLTVGPIDVGDNSSVNIRND